MKLVFGVNQKTTEHILGWPFWYPDIPSNDIWGGHVLIINTWLPHLSYFYHTFYTKYGYMRRVCIDADYISKMTFNLLKLSQLSQYVNMINVPIFQSEICMLCSFETSMLCRFNFKLIFYFLKLSHFPPIPNLNNLPNFYLILICSVVLKWASFADYFSLIIFCFLNFLKFKLH